MDETKVSNAHALQRFAAVIIRIRDPKTTALVFASGKMVRFLGSEFLNSAHHQGSKLACCYKACQNILCGKQVVTGAKSEQASLLAAKKVFLIHANYHLSLLLH